VTGRLPRGVSGKQTVDALERVGYRPLRIRGDHQILRSPSPRPGAHSVVAVPLHRELATGTLAGILRRVGLTAEEFRELLG
jgi:predicted RNA binding protein YcfA (HicA-like mRNA interferase family)